MTDFKLTKHLSDVPSELLQQALDDLEKVEADPRYIVDMCRWHQPLEDQRCAVCLAGAVLAGSGLSYTIDWRHIEFNVNIERKLGVIDSLRTGDARSAICSLHHASAPGSMLRTKYGDGDSIYASFDNVFEQLPQGLDRAVTPYSDNPAKWRAEMVQLVADLRANGL
jgi:hypothetical protein